MLMIIKSDKNAAYCPPPFAKAGDIKSHSSVRPSVRPSVCHINFNLAHIFWGINDRTLIFGMHDPCDKPFLLVPWGDLELWPRSRSNLLPGGGPQFFEFACFPDFTMDPKQKTLIIINIPSSDVTGTGADSQSQDTLNNITQTIENSATLAGDFNSQVNLTEDASVSIVPAPPDPGSPEWSEVAADDTPYTLLVQAHKLQFSPAPVPLHEGTEFSTQPKVIVVDINVSLSSPDKCSMYG